MRSDCQPDRTPRYQSLTVRNLKDMLAQLPAECDNMKVAYGHSDIRVPLDSAWMDFRLQDGLVIFRGMKS